MRPIHPTRPPAALAPEPTRRALLQRLGLSMAVAPLAPFLQDCPGDETPAPSDWATGGTANMGDTYPDPFTGGTGTACTLYCAMTLGPCFADSPERQDISEGFAEGLPTRLSLRIVEADGCTPVANAAVDLWHAAPNGIYSGREAAAMCTGGDTDMLSHHYFRGTWSTDADGRVDFDTCFPGWYAGRAIHIHFTVRRNNSAYLTSQFFFSQALVNDIFTTHPEYAPYGTPDTTNQSDSVLGGADPTPYLMDSNKRPDGTLQVWKTVALRANLAQQSCAVGD